ncbi:hypothetical protein CPB84DRAFT_1769457 [Gymnopilus junonius]|uniref:Uncharacterized protein n=1 Tax=Gymnopilus junonius TaxID=109634 RepID=A0A9P5NVY3_GYMJU|nr:hypothetical protein CPB84DRAFT_1769457 [Gymnopilus junonius]
MAIGNHAVQEGSVRPSSTFPEIQHHHDDLLKTLPPYFYFHVIQQPTPILHSLSRRLSAPAMSRYSRIFLRHKHSGHASSWTAESSSAEPASTTSPGFSYPPSSTSRYSPFPFQPNSISIASPTSPHPYTLGAMPYAIPETSATTHTQQTTTEFSTTREKPPDSPGVGHQYHQHTPSRAPPLPLHLRPLVLLLLFLPLPPLLSFMYLVTGHAFLRAIEMSPTSIYRTPLLASLEAGATGGVILALPIAFLLYLFLLSARPSSAPEDFFDDDNSSILARAAWVRYTGYIVSAVLFICIGGAAGPLGVTCLSSGDLDAFVAHKRMLSADAAAAAGLIGGVLVALGILAMCVVGAGVWTIWIRQKEPSGS